MFAALLPIVIPAQILLYVSPGVAGNGQQALFLGGLAALGAVTALIVQPVVGALSDRTSTRLGKRRPYILGGGVVLLAGLGLLAFTHQIALFILGMFFVVVAHTASSTAYQGLVPDRVPPAQRGVASGYMGLMTILGTVGSLAVASLLLSQAGAPGSAFHTFASGVARGASVFYIVGACLVVIAVVVTLVEVRETPQPAMAARGGASNEPRRRRLARLWLEPWRHANFTWVFLTRGFVVLGLALFTTYIAYYFAQVEHVANFVQATAINAVLALGGAVLSTLIIGVLSDRVRRRAPIVSTAGGFMALTALAFVVAPGSIPLWPLGVLFGLGYGAYMSVDLALAVDALPSHRDAGKDLGLWSMASTLPAVLAPVLGSAVIFVAGMLGQTAFGYRAVFALATIFLILGAVFVLKVRERRHAHDIAPGGAAEPEPRAAVEAEGEPAA
ncbi:MAG TPA: MFS transporter [Ktedonobacterales bacterium]|nr:MFS transporter [Ktedonobacterales bacterium]